MAPAAALVAILLVLLAPSSESAVTSCKAVTNDLSTCRTYLQTGIGNPPKSCCDGAKALIRATTTTADKQKACSCIQNLAKLLKVKFSAARALPGYCKVTFPFTVSPNTDCSKVK